ncbi:hypothetical protein SK128_014407 [Halocaridina rubra]|uniref:Uncharacterized protein n=1 Tax=Halocaridina rubra TaxID=373956 RepID=A0AAN9A5B5_HALRR
MVSSSSLPAAKLRRVCNCAYYSAMPARREVLPLGNLCVEAIAQLLVTIVEVTYKFRLAEAKNQTHEISNKNDIKPNENCENGNNNTSIEANGQTVENANESKQNGHLESAKLESEKDLPTEKTDTVIENQLEVVSENYNYNNDSQSDRPNAESDNFNMIADTKKKQNGTLKLEKLDAYRNDLIHLLTSHCHVTMHGTLFSALVHRFSDLYMGKRGLRPIIQEIVPLFLNSSLRELDYGKSRMFAEAEMCQILFDHLENAPGLLKVDIGRSCYWRLSVFEKLNLKLKSLSNLEVLRIQYICTPEMISGLVDNCPSLCELNLKGSEKITDAECDEIARCKSLQYLDITGTRITGKGCWKIIESIKNLACLQHCAFNCNSDALLFESRAHLFHCIKEQALHRDDPVSLDEHAGFSNVFNLKNFWLFNPCTADLSSTLLCPHLEHLRLDFIFQDLSELPEVEVLSSIPNLTKFQANLYDRCIVDLVSPMIEGCGSKLTTLDLLLADDYFFAAQIHNVVARCCPNLSTLRFSGDYMARHSLEDCDNCLDFEIETPAHPHLEHLSITGVVSDSRLRFVLSHTPSIRTLTLDGELEWVHDDTFRTLLETVSFPNLELVWFNVSTTITLHTVRLLLSCENSLHKIGRLCHMAEATMSEYHELQNFVRQNNLDVQLIWVTDERCRN